MTTKTLARRTRQRGFSVIELVIVMGIIVIMIGIALFSLPTARQALAVDNAGSQLVEDSVVWTKLRTLREGADLATRRLWR